MRWKVKVALALVFLAALFNVSADEHRMQGQTALGTKSLSGYVSSTITSRTQRLRSGIAGQVFLILPILNLDDGLGDYDTEPMQLRLWVYAKIGGHFRYVGSFETARDGCFSFDAPPGTYMLEPDPSSEYSLGGVIGLYTDTFKITVFPGQISYDDIYVVSVASASPFPGLN
jgi:hypothetical protein